MPNVEIKCRYENLEKGKKIAESLGARFSGVLHQEDTYFQTQAGRLKLREINGEMAQLIPYVRPSERGPKLSQYAVLPVEEPKKVKELLSTILKKEVVVKKKRHLYLIDQLRVHLDEVEGLGCFLEFEAVFDDPKLEEKEREKVGELLSRFEISENDLLRGSYREMRMNLGS